MNWESVLDTVVYGILLLGAFHLGAWAERSDRRAREAREKRNQTVENVGPVTVTMTGYTPEEEARIIETIRRGQEGSSK